MDTKYCHACKLELSVNSFGKNRSTEDGLQGQCRSCRSERQRASKTYVEGGDARKRIDCVCQFADAVEKVTKDGFADLSFA